MWSHVLAFLWCLCSRQRGIILPDLEVTGELLPCDRWVWNSSSCFLPVFWEMWSMHHPLLYLSNGVKAQMSKLRRLSLCSPLVCCTVPSLQIPCRWIHWWRCPWSCPVKLGQLAPLAVGESYVLPVCFQVFHLDNQEHSCIVQGRDEHAWKLIQIFWCFS